MQKNNRMINIVFCVFLCFITPLSASVEKVVLQLKWKHQYQFAGYYMAKEKGYYDEAGLDVEIRELNENEGVTSMLESGEAHFGIGSSDLIMERAKGRKIVLLASVFQHSPHIFITKKWSGIDTIHSIIGKTVAMEPQSNELLVYLNSEGIDNSKINIIKHPWELKPFIDDRIDVISAYSTDEPYELKGKGVDINIFSPRAGGIDFYGDTLYTTQEILRKNPKMIDKFVKASMKGWDYALKHKQEAIGVILSQYSTRHTLEHLVFEAEETEKLIVPQIIEIGFTNKDRWKRIADFYVTAGLINKNYNLDGFFYQNDDEKKLTAMKNIAKYLSWAVAALGIIVIVVMIFAAKLRKEINEKTRAQNSLAASEARYKLLAENTVECIWLLNLKDMQYKYISPSVERLRGITVEEAMAEKLEDSLTPDSLSEVMRVTHKRMESFYAGDRSTETMEGLNELQQYCKDGSIIDVEISTKYVYDTESESLEVLGVSRNITERKKLEKRLIREMEEKNILIEKISMSSRELRELLTIIEQSPISVVITDIGGTIRYANKTVFELTGYTKEELVGKTPRIFSSGYHGKEFYEEMWKTIRNGQEWRGEFRNIKKNGRVFWEKAIIIPVKDEQGKIYSFLAVKEDVTESRRQLEMLHYHAERDTLTGIHNRRAGLEILVNAVDESKSREKALSICFIDLNGLKIVNDTHGHDFGDEMIIQFCRAVMECLREKDTFFRLGGDEFMIIFRECHMETAEKIWDRIREALNKRNITGGLRYLLSASHGISEYNSEKHKQIEDFIAEADKKMYEEKKKNKDKGVV